MLGLAIAAALLSWPPLVAPTAGAVPTSDPCAVRGSRTLEQTLGVRVFARRVAPRVEAVFACLRRTGRVSALDLSVRPRNRREGRFHLRQIRIAGPFVGFARLVRCDDRMLCEDSVAVRDLRDDTELVSRQTRSFPQPSDVAVTRTGSVAWIRAGRVPQVRKLDADGEDLLEEAATIAPRSLGARGTSIRWRRGHVPRAADMAADDRCGRRGSVGLARSPLVRIYRVSRTVFGCTFGTGRRTRLGTSFGCYVDNCLLGPIVIAGRFVAYDDGITARRERIANLRVVDLGRGRRVHAWDRHDSTIVDIEMLRNGNVAWIAPVGSDGDRVTYAVLKSTAGREAIELDRGGGIDPTSLSLVGGVISWRHDGHTRSAPLWR